MNGSLGGRGVVPVPSHDSRSLDQNFVIIRKPNGGTGNDAAGCASPVVCGCVQADKRRGFCQAVSFEQRHAMGLEKVRQPAGKGSATTPRPAQAPTGERLEGVTSQGKPVKFLVQARHGVKVRGTEAPDGGNDFPGRRDSSDRNTSDHRLEQVGIEGIAVVDG